MPNGNSLGGLEPPIELSDEWIAPCPVPLRTSDLEPSMDILMGEGINSYTLEKLVADFRHGSLWEFVDFEYETCRKDFGIQRRFPGEVFYRAVDNVFLGKGAMPAIVAALEDQHFVAIGEIGLDFFVPGLNESPMREKQEHFYVGQLKLAREFKLPVLLHVRRSQDVLLKHLRRLKVVGGIAHAFNGSFQQAQAFIDLGFRLGFGGAMTYTRALQIRRLASELPLSAIVLETDAPDLSPAWRHPDSNSPEEVARIGEVLAQLRGITTDAAAQATSSNAYAALPRLRLASVISNH